MRKALTITIILILSISIAFALEITDPELKKLLEENPELEKAIEENPDLKKLAIEQPELLKKTIQEQLSETPEIGTSIIPQEAQEELLKKQFEQLKNEINPQIQKLPSIVRWFCGDERINLQVGDQLMLALTMENCILEKVEIGMIEKPTINVHISLEAMIQIQEKGVNMEEAIKQGLIKYEVVRFWTKVKLFIMKTIYKIAT